MGTKEKSDATTDAVNEAYDVVVEHLADHHSQMDGRPAFSHHIRLVGRRLDDLAEMMETDPRPSRKPAV